MSRRLVGITLDNLGDLDPGSRECVFWELSPAAAAQARANGASAAAKEAWVSTTLLEWGGCGRIVYVDGIPVGHILFAPAGAVPRAAAFPTSPVGADAVVLTTAAVHPDFTGQGLGRMLVQAVARDALKRGVRAVEAFGAMADAAPDPDDPGHRCLLPAGFLLAVGFKTVRPHRHTPRLRLDLRTTLSWRTDVEFAIERLLSTISATPRPA